jgi:hypothetical protein
LLYASLSLFLQPNNAALLWKVFSRVAKNIEASHPDKRFLRAYVLYFAFMYGSRPEYTDYVVFEGSDAHAYMRPGSDEGFKSARNSSQIVMLDANPTDSMSPEESARIVKAVQKMHEAMNAGLSQYGYSVHNFNEAYLHQVPSAFLVWLPFMMLKVLLEIDGMLDKEDAEPLYQYKVGPQAKPSVIVHSKLTHPSNPAMWFEMRVFLQHLQFGLYFEKKFPLQDEIQQDTLSKLVPCILDLRFYLQCFQLRMPESSLASLLDRSIDDGGSMKDSHSNWMMNSLKNVSEICDYSKSKLVQDNIAKTLDGTCIHCLCVLNLNFPISTFLKPSVRCPF